LVRSGRTAAAVAATGVAVPFALGWALMAALGRPQSEALFVGAALTATSVGITARVLSDLNRLGLPESQIILGAAVIDDVIGVVLLALLQGAGSAGEALKSGALIAAFAAGLLTRARKANTIERLTLPAAAWLAPVFFVMVGAKADLSACGPVVLPLVAVAVAGKLASALAVPARFNRWAVGIGMIPRGEVGLIFAQIGLTAGLVSPELYAALIATVVVTTVLAPPLLSRSLGASSR